MKNEYALINNSKENITVKPPIIIGTNQYAQADLFLYPDQTDKKNNPGIIAKVPKRTKRKYVMINESTTKTNDVLPCKASIGFEC